MHKFAKFAIVTASALLAGGIAVPMAQARPMPQYPEGVTPSCQGKTVYRLGGASDVSMKFEQVSDTKFCVQVTKGYFHTPYKTIGLVDDVDITTGRKVTSAKTSWGKYVHIPVGKCVDTSLRLNSRNSDTVTSGKFCNNQK